MNIEHLRNIILILIDTPFKQTSLRNLIWEIKLRFPDKQDKNQFQLHKYVGMDEYATPYKWCFNEYKTMDNTNFARAARIQHVILKELSKNDEMLKTMGFNEHAEYIKFLHSQP